MKPKHIHPEPIQTMLDIMTSLSRTILLGFLCLSLAFHVSAQDETVVTEEATQEEAAPAEEGAANGIPTDEASITQGLEIFEGNCQQCHKVNERLVGPALANVWERQDVPWIINFIKYPQKVIDSGDEYAVALYEEYNQYMPNHDFLKDEEILSILAYVQDHTNNPSKYEKEAVVAEGTGVATEEEAISANTLLIVTIGLGALLLLVLVVLGLLVSTLTKYMKVQKGLSDEDKEALDTSLFNPKAIFQSPLFLGTASFIFLAVLFKAIFTGLFAVGVQQGYAPTQPIPFSHKLHAGYYEIDCQYCHTSANKSKSAGIPSANLCMNCHGEIKQGSEQIQKIYAAIENDEPIQWVRVHNLPDLAYFNHSQHVNVAGLECQTCHGEIQEMEVVQQISLLTMGWCVNCHRESEVAGKDNEYYDNLIKLHNARTKEPLHVEDIGGLECSKCHY